MAEIAATGDVLRGESLRRKATPTALAATARGRRSHRCGGQHAADTAAKREPGMEISMWSGNLVCRGEAPLRFAVLAPAPPEG